MKKSFIIHSLEQAVKDMPTSSARKPQGLHRGPGKRQMSEKERNSWLFMRKTELMDIAQWDDPENFKHLPKAKKIIGNEASVIVWPYAILLQNRLKVHPFTKSLYCYHFQYSFSTDGAERNRIAREFSRECMVPITFHNQQCYVESEMILDYGEIPFLVVHCLDETSVVVPILGNRRTLEAGLAAVMQLRNPEVTKVASPPAEQQPSPHDFSKSTLARDVERITEDLGNSVENPCDTWRIFHDRPLQSAFLKVNYQWFGETQKEREQHLVNFTWPWDSDGVRAPAISDRKTRISMALNSTPRTVPEKLQFFKGARGVNQSTGQLDSVRRQLDTRSFSNGSRWGSPRRSGAI